jgi:hypothetical protein
MRSPCCLLGQVNCCWSLPVSQHSHSRFWVLRDPWPYFTLSQLWESCNCLTLLMLCSVYIMSGQTTEKTPSATAGCGIFYVVHIVSSRWSVLPRTCHIPCNTYAYNVAIFVWHVWHQHITLSKLKQSQFSLQHYNRSLFLELYTRWSSWLAFGAMWYKKYPYLNMQNWGRVRIYAYWAVWSAEPPKLFNFFAFFFLVSTYGWIHVSYMCVWHNAIVQVVCMVSLK